MGKLTGFMEYERRQDPYREPEERIGDYDEIYAALGPEERKKQAARCMDCGSPFCQSGMMLSGMATGCPLHNLIPEWNDFLYQDHLDYALSRLLKTNNFPEFTGRVCPALCEKACCLGMNNEPVTVHNNELYLIEEGFRQGLVKPVIPEKRTGKRVAVVGSGPAGLAAAEELCKRGHSVTVYEREDRIGGLLTYGIPNQKLSKAVVARRKRLLEEEGISFITGCDVGRDITGEELEKQYDAVVLCCGAKKPRSLEAENIHKTRDVYYAVDYLTSVTKHLLDEKEPEVSARGKRVVIVGGGDTGNDCVGTCIRQGAADVIQLEMMPEPPELRTADNPWPEWPKVKKTDYGQQEAIALFGKDPRIYKTTVKSLNLDENGRLTSITTIKVGFEGREVVRLSGTEEELPCELLIIAAGFLGAQEYAADAFRVALSNRGQVLTTAGKHTVRTDGEAGIFTAGDMHRGQSLVVWAIAEGREAAAEVDEYLSR